MHACLTQQVGQMNRRSRMNTKDTAIWIPFLIERDGRFCNYCKTPLHLLKHKIEVDHKNGNPYDNPKDGSNYQLLCKKCNNEQYHRQRHKQQIIEDRPYSPSMQTNARSEPKWSNWICNNTLEKGSTCKGEAIANGAYSAEVSPASTRRYLNKRLGENGLYESGWGKCTSELCNGTHIYFKGDAPKKD